MIEQEHTSLSRAASPCQGIFINGWISIEDRFSPSRPILNPSDRFRARDYARVSKFGRRAVHQVLFRRVF
jgi:hypothetical protein